MEAGVEVLTVGISGFAELQSAASRVLHLPWSIFFDETGRR